MYQNKILIEMKKEAKDIQIGDKFQPWISERTMKRVKTQHMAIGLPQKQDGNFSHYVLIPSINQKRLPDEVFIFSEEIVIIV